MMEGERVKVPQVPVAANAFSLPSSSPMQAGIQSLPYGGSGGYVQMSREHYELLRSKLSAGSKRVEALKILQTMLQEREQDIQRYREEVEEYKSALHKSDLKVGDLIRAQMQPVNTRLNSRTPSVKHSRPSLKSGFNSRHESNAQDTSLCEDGAQSTEFMSNPFYNSDSDSSSFQLDSQPDEDAAPESLPPSLSLEPAKLSFSKGSQPSETAACANEKSDTKTNTGSLSHLTFRDSNVRSLTNLESMEPIESINLDSGGMVSQRLFDKIVTENVRLKKALEENLQKGTTLKEYLAAEKYEHVVKELREKLHHQKDCYEKLCNILTAKDSNRTEELAKKCTDLQQVVWRLEKTMVAKQALIDSYSQEYCRISTTNATLMEKISKLQAQAGHTDHVDNKEVDAHDELEAKLQEAEEKLTEYQSKLAQGEEEYCKLKEEYKKSQDRLMKVLTVSKEAKLEPKSPAESTGARPKETTQLQKENQSMKDKLKMLQDDLEKEKKTVHRLGQVLTDHQLVIRRLHDENSKVQDLVKSKEQALKDEREQRQTLERTFSPLMSILPQLQSHFEQGAGGPTFTEMIRGPELGLVTDGPEEDSSLSDPQSLPPAPIPSSHQGSAQWYRGIPPPRDKPRASVPKGMPQLKLRHPIDPKNPARPPDSMGFAGPKSLPLRKPQPQHKVSAAVQNAGASRPAAASMGAASGPQPATASLNQPQCPRCMRDDFKDQQDFQEHCKRCMDFEEDDS